jgi:hypothetical protein
VCYSSVEKSEETVICITRLENAILQVQARFLGQRRQPRPTSASICKTFSSRVIHKISFLLKKNTR